MLSDAALYRVLRSSRRVALWGDLIRAVLIGTVLLVLASFAVYYAALVRLMFNELHMNDFGKFYYSARAYLDGQDMYGPTVATAIPLPNGESRQFLNMNPPHFQLLMLPLAMLAPATAFGIWWALSIVCAGFAVSAITRELRLRWTPSGALWTTFLIVTSAATGTVIITGQLTFLLVLPVTWAWVAARRGNWNQAAYLIGFLASVKPFFGVFAVYLLLTRQFAALAKMLITIAAITVAGVIVTGPEPYAAWLRALSAVDWTWAAMNGGLMGLLARTLAASPFFQPLTSAPQLITPLWLFGSSVVALATFVMLLRDRAREADRAFSGLLLMTQLISPLGWVYYLWFVGGPAAGLVRDGRRSPNRAATALFCLAMLGLLCPLMATLAGAGHRWASISVGSTYTWSTLLLWAAWLVCCARLRNPSQGLRSR